MIAGIGKPPSFGERDGSEILANSAVYLSPLSPFLKETYAINYPKYTGNIL